MPRRHAGLALAAACAFAPAATAHAAPTTTVPLSTAGGTFLTAPTGWNAMGAYAAGDVNGDGRADAIAVTQADSGQRGYAVVFGRTGGGPIDVSRLGSGGFSITGAGEVTPIGDVNNDGRDDLSAVISGDRLAIIFGKTSPTAVNAGFLAKGQGYRITGAEVRGGADGLGDLNGDGRDDFVAAGYMSATNTSAARVIFGKGTSDAQDFATAPGFSIGCAECREPNASDAGDLDGDGKHDIVYSMSGVGGGVIYGRASTTPVDAATPGSAGFRLTGLSANSFVRGAGDVTADGRAELTADEIDAVIHVGARRTAPLDITTQPSLKLRLGTTPPGQSSFTIAPLGDLNRDGRGDLIYRGLPNELYLVPGRTAPGTVDVSQLGTTGIRLTGTADEELVGSPVGDFDGDRLPDLAVTTLVRDPDTYELVRSTVRILTSGEHF